MFFPALTKLQQADDVERAWKLIRGEGSPGESHCCADSGGSGLDRAWAGRVFSAGIIMPREDPCGYTGPRLLASHKQVHLLCISTSWSRFSDSRRPCSRSGALGDRTALFRAPATLGQSQLVDHLCDLSRVARDNGQMIC